MTDTPTDLLSLAREAAPTPTSFSRPFWEATRERKILIQYCPTTKRYQFFPRPAGLATGRRDLEWREVAGTGEVFSYTITRRARGPLRGHEPFIVATVTLDEGVNVMANLVGITIADVHIGLRVAPTWAPLPNGMNLLMFRPAAA